MLNYADFTKRNHVTKAVRFELIPQGRTLETINEKGDKEYDKALYESLDRMKAVIDSFIKDVSGRALSDLKHDFSALYEAKISKDGKTMDKEAKTLTRNVTNHVEKSLPDGLKLSQINSAKFLQDVLREYVLHTDDTSFDKAQALKDIDATKGCLSLFNKFLTTRITALSVWMPKRVMKNLDIYIENMKRAGSILDSSDASFEVYSDELRSIMTIDYYSMVLSQNDIDGYNSLISGIITENGTQQKGLNQLINEYNQKTKNEKLDRPYLKRLIPLYKQILMPQEKKFKIDAISTDDEVRDIVKTAYESFVAAEKEMSILIENKRVSSDGKGIIVRGNAIHMLSHLLTGEHKTISEKILARESAEINELLKEDSLKPSMKKELGKRLENLAPSLVKRNYEMAALDEYVLPSDKSVLSPAHTAFTMYAESYLSAVKTVKASYKVLEIADIFGKRKIKGDRDVQQMLVDFFGALTDVRDILSIIRLPKDEEAGDAAFYDEYAESFEGIRLTYKAENLVRNYITKSVKDIAQEKQTCFGTPARLRAQWWNGEKRFSKDHVSIIRHAGKYYYFILAGDSKPVDVPEMEGSESKFLTLKKGQKSFMMLPKILFTDHAVPFFEADKDASEYIFDDEQVIRPVKVTRDVYDIYRAGLFKKDAIADGRITEEEYKKNIAALIDTYKDFARAYSQYVKFDLTMLSDTESYSDIGEFFADVDIYTSKLSWTDIDFGKIEKLVDNGTAYLFLISNRFIYSGKEDKNQYTKTFLSILSDENMKKTTILLNGGASVFFRPQALENKPTHKAGSFLVNKRTVDGEPIPRDIYEAIYKLKNDFTNLSEADAKKAKDYMAKHEVRAFRTAWDISYKKNYMSDKYILQLTYTKNNDVSDRNNDMLNDRVRDAIKDGFNMVSVARSTTDMVYCMAMDGKFNILEEKSLNVIDGMDYYKLLHDAYTEKVNDKKLWVYDTESSDLKAAYVDLAITEVIKMARKYNAVIVVENISDQVKDKYSFLDNQVFKTFESRIAERLSDLSFKDIGDGLPGSVNNPLQLSNNSGNTYQDGVLFFVNGAYTRGIDPENGFASLFDFGRYNSIASKRQFFAGMKDIRFDGRDFTFTFDYKNYPVRYETTKTEWTVNVGGSVVIFDREKKTNHAVEDMVNEILIPLSNGADLTGNLAEKMMGKDIPGVFVDELMKQFKVALAGVHRKTLKTDAFFKSPVGGREYNICHTAAYNLGRKLLFRMEYAGNSADFTKEWLNYMQA